MEVLFPPYRADLAGERLWQGTREIRLRPKTFAVLRYLAERPGRLVSTEELLRAVWPDVTVTDVMPRLCVRELRAALRDDAHAPRFIETRPRRGYRFMAPVLPLTIRDSPAAGPSTERGLGPGRPPLVGRTMESDRLRAVLERARRGDRQVVFVTGEPGIGKTRLVEAFLAPLAASDVLIAQGDCIEQYGASEPYLPVLAALERLCRRPDGHSVIQSLRRMAPGWLAQMPSLVEPAEHAQLMDRLAASTAHRMLRELGSLLESIAADRLLVVWLEDLHWADHSTLEAIAFVARRAERARLMLIGTYRPADVPGADHPLTRTVHALSLHQHAAEIPLTRLPEADVAEYLAARFAGTPVSPRLVHHVHVRTDGNPLFMVTVTEDLLARTRAVERDGEWDLDGTHADGPADVPDALRRLIEQQAARLTPEERQLLGVASVAGMEFSSAAVAAGIDEPTAVIETRCVQLATRGQFLQAREAIEWPDGTIAAAYAFVHALHAEVFYAAIPAGRRRELHGRIAERLERAFLGRDRDIATELAMHFDRARDPARAAHYLRIAGEIALARAAHADAIGHLSRGLTLLQRLPDSVERSRLEIAFHLALGPAWILTRGYAAAEVERTYSRALELARSLGERPQVVRALRGLWNVRLVRAELDTARRLAAELLARGRTARDPALCRAGHADLGETLFHLGRLKAAREHLGQALALPRRRAARRHGTQQWPRVASYASWGLWMAGCADRARALSNQAVAEARRLGSPHNRAFSLGFASLIHEFCGDVPRVAELVEEQATVCREYDIPYWQTWADMLRAWSLARRGDALDGARAMRRALEAHRETGAVVGVTHFLILLANVHARAGQLHPGLAAANEALDLALRTGNRYLEPEIHRVRGDLLLRLTDRGEVPGPTSGCAPAEAEACYRRAIVLSRRRGARAFELRAATSLAGFWHRRGESERARRVLGPLAAWFTEGADTADVVTARRLLAGLSPRAGVLDPGRARRRTAADTRDSSIRRGGPPPRPGRQKRG